MENREDQAILEGLRRGEEEAVRRLVRRHGGFLYSLAVRLTGNREDAEEAVQDALLRACRGAGGFRGESSLRTWLFRIAVNSAKMRRRSQSRHRER